MNISVREGTYNDIELIADYWLGSTKEYLHSMGADIEKLPSRQGFSDMLTKQIDLSYNQKVAYVLIWLMDGQPIGHTNVNDIIYGQSAYMHLHLWVGESRKRGIGTILVKEALPYFFENLELKELFCQPYALNEAPNKTLKKVGFEFQKKYITTPGSINFEQEVVLWKLTRERYKGIK